MKKIISLLVVVALLVFIQSKSYKIEKYLAEDRYYSLLAMVGLVERCYNPHKHIDEVFIQENINYNQADREIVQNSLEKIIDSKRVETTKLKIPAITHHIYFTPLGSKSQLNDFYIEKMKAQFKKLNDLGVNWQHNIWTNNSNLFPKEITQILGVDIRNIKEFEGHVLYKSLEETVEKGKELKAYFSEASDLMRFMAVQRFGGIYTDMDYEVYNPKALLDLMAKFDFMGGRESEGQDSLYGSAFIAAKSNHPVLNEIIKLTIRNHNIEKETPDYIKYPCTERDRIYFNAPPLVTIAYLNSNNLDGNEDVILPSWMIFNQKFAHYKNKLCDYSQISTEDFRRSNDNLDQLLIDYTKSINDNREGNIYYSLKDRQIFPIIGADMGCGTWVTMKNPRLWHWKKW